MEEGARVIERCQQEILLEFGHIPEYSGIYRDERGSQEEYDQDMKKMEKEGVMMQLSEGHSDKILQDFGHTPESPRIHRDERRAQEEYDQDMKEGAMMPLSEGHHEKILQNFRQTPEYPGVDRDERRSLQEEYDQYMRKRMEEGAMMQFFESQCEKILQTPEYLRVDGDRGIEEEYGQYMKKMLEEEGAMMQIFGLEKVLQTPERPEYPGVDGDGRRSTQEYDQYVNEMEGLALDTPETPEMMGTRWSPLDPYYLS